MAITSRVVLAEVTNRFTGFRVKFFLSAVWHRPNDVGRFPTCAKVQTIECEGPLARHFHSTFLDGKVLPVYYSMADGACLLLRTFIIYRTNDATGAAPQVLFRDNMEANACLRQ